MGELARPRRSCTAVAGRRPRCRTSVVARPARGRLEQLGEDLVGPLEPAWQHVDPGAVGQLGALDPAGQLTHADVPDAVESGVEERGLEPDGHIAEPSTCSNTCASANLIVGGVASCSKTRRLSAFRAATCDASALFGNGI